MKTLFPILLFCLLLASCETDEVGRRGLDPISKSMLYDSISPAFPHDYVEIREIPCWDFSKYSVKYSKGTYPLSDSIYCSKGVIFTLADLCEFCSVLTIDEGEPTFWSTYEDIVYFLSPIDCIGDALFLAHLKGYTFQYDDEAFGYKEVKGKYYLEALQLVSACAPVQTDRFYLEIDERGNIKVLDQEVYHSLKDACI